MSKIEKIGLIFAVLFVALAFVSVGIASVATIYVPDNYSTIQEAADAANAGDTIVVRDGNYTENVKVNKRLTIRSGNSSDKTIVQAATSEDPVFNVTADYVNISGFTVKGADTGIYLYNADYCNISNNNCSSNRAGVYSNYSKSSGISNNICSNNVNYGVRLSHSKNNSISNNTCSYNGCGMDLWYSENNSISGNKCSYNKNRGMDLRYSENNGISNNICFYNWYGMYFWHSKNNNISDNKCISNGHGIFLSDSNSRISNNKCLGNWYGIFLWNSKNNNISDNICSHSLFDGIYLTNNSNSNSISNNKCSNNRDDGIYLNDSNNTSISNNLCSNNRDDGIQLSYSNNISLSNNICSNNGNGIYLRDSNNIIIYLNNFINNDENVYSYDSTNIWNSLSKITYTYNGKRWTNYLGNYWSDYNGSDVNSDGIGNTAYNINSDRDNYPLIKPFENYFYAAEESSEEIPAKFQKGMSYAAWWHDTYGSADSDTSLENIKTTGTEWVSLVVTWYQDNVSSTKIYRDENRTPTDDSLIHAINKIHSINMSVMLKPTVDLQDENWRGNINFDNVAYSDALDWDWQDWSWDCNRNFDSTTSVYRGKYAINASFEPWGGLSFANPEGVNTDRYDRLEFYINGGERGGQQLRLSLTDDKGNELPSYGRISINNPKYVHDGVISAKTWKLVSIPFEDLDKSYTPYKKPAEDVLKTYYFAKKQAYNTGSGAYPGISVLHEKRIRCNRWRK